MAVGFDFRRWQCFAMGPVQMSGKGVTPVERGMALVDIALVDELLNVYGLDMTFPFAGGPERISTAVRFKYAPPSPSTATAVGGWYWSHLASKRGDRGDKRS